MLTLQLQNRRARLELLDVIRTARAFLVRTMTRVGLDFGVRHGV